MDRNNELNQYITIRYEHWVRYAKLHIRLSGLQIDPAEVVNEVLCSLLERNTDRLHRMMKARRDKATELDYFVMRVIKISIHSPRSPLRYRRGQHCTDNFDEYRVEKPQPDEAIDKNEIHELVGNILAEMNLPKRDVELFVWKFFDRKTISRWPGNEDRKDLYGIYNRIWKEIVRRVREKLTS